MGAGGRWEKNMAYVEIMKRIKERFAASGLSPSRRIEILNLLLELGQWLKANPFPVHFESRLDLYRYLNNEIAGNGPIDYLEFGVYQGDATRVLDGAEWPSRIAFLRL